MSFDRQAEYRKQLEHLVSMARNPLWKAYARRSAKEALRVHLNTSEGA